MQCSTEGMGVSGAIIGILALLDRELSQTSMVFAGCSGYVEMG